MTGETDIQEQLRIANCGLRIRESTQMAPNKANLCRFWAKNAGWARKQSQFASIRKAGTGTTRCAESFGYAQDKLPSPRFPQISDRRGDSARLDVNKYAKQTQFFSGFGPEMRIWPKSKPNSKPILGKPEARDGRPEGNGGRNAPLPPRSLWDRKVGT